MKIPGKQIDTRALGAVGADVYLEAPTTFAYASSYAIDTSLKNDFACSGILTGPITFTFVNVAANHQGKFAARQDGTGGRVVTITAPAGWTLYRDSGTADLQAAAGPNAVTVWVFTFEAVGGLNMLLIGKLTPVAA